MNNKQIIKHKKLIPILLLVTVILSNCTSNYLKQYPPPKKVIHEKIHPPLKFLIIGDSMIGGYFGLMLTRKLNRIPGVSARRIFRKSTGLSELVRYNWPAKSIEFIRKYRPDVLIVMFGSNDGLALRLKTGRLIYYNSPGWEELYRERIVQYFRLVVPLVKKVYFVGQPSTSHAFFVKRYPALNMLYREVCIKVPGVEYIPAWEMTSRNGKYLPYMVDNYGKKARVKSEYDHVHHTRFGGRVLAELVFEYIQGYVEFTYRKGL